MKYEIRFTLQFKKAYKLCMRRGLKMSSLEKVIRLLAETGELPPHYRPHKLSGQFSHVWECHVESDWLLMWEIDNNEMYLLFLNTGTHSDLF